MRQITIDFTSQLQPLCAGYIGEHNATEIFVVRPADLTGVMYSIAFMTNGEVIHSKYFSADEEIKIALWQQLTLDNDLYVQLEAFDENGDYLGKSTTAKLVLSNSVHGTDVIADADNPDVYSEIALNTWFRETLEDNVDTLDKLTTSKEGRLLFDGKPLVGGSGNGTDGFSPIIEIEEIANGHRVTITDADGTESFDVLNGYTPVKGVDYFTDADKTEIKDAVLDEMPDIPTKTSDLENDSNFVTAEYVTNAINGTLGELENLIDESGVLE